MTDDALNDTLARLRRAYDAELAEAAHVADELAIVTDGDALPRIERLRRFALWLHDQGRADESGSIARVAGALACTLEATGEDDRLHVRLRDAEHRAHVMFTTPRVVRDAARQAGVRKERRPGITEWIARQLERDAKAKSPELWARAPDWIKDQVGERRFASRLTAQRKLLTRK